MGILIDFEVPIPDHLFQVKPAWVRSDLWIRRHSCAAPGCQQAKN